MAQRREHKGSVELRTYAGKDPAGGSPWIYATVPAGTGKREADRIEKALDARAALLAAERRRARREGLSPRQRAEQRAAGADEVTFRQAAEAWYAEHRDQLQPGGQGTPRVVLDAWLLPRLGDVELWRIRPSVAPFEADRCPELVSLKDIYRDLAAAGGVRGGGLDAGSLARAHGIVRQVLGYAMAQGWVAGNAARETRPAPYRRKVRPLPSDEAMRQFLGLLAAEHPDVHCAALLVMSGLRPNEVLALRISSVDLDRRVALAGLEGVVNVRGDDGRERSTVVEGDTEKRRLRRFRLSAGACEAVSARLARLGAIAADCELAVGPDAFLFSPDPAGRGHYGEGWAGQAFARWVARARPAGMGLPTGFVLYDCRHYAITKLLAAGHPVADVADRFATSPRMIYATYAHCLPEAADGMADTLDRLLHSPDGQ